MTADPTWSYDRLADVYATDMGASMPFDDVGFYRGLAQDSGGRVLDLDGRTVAPGLMNAHSHICLDGTSPDPELILRAETPAENAVLSAARLLRTLRMGVTSIRDVGAPWGVDIALRRLVERR